jgi:hypothetical protein
MVIATRMLRKTMNVTGLIIDGLPESSAHREKHASAACISSILSSI